MKFLGGGILNDVGQDIYHYTTVGSLISILSTGIFRFYSLQEGNDPKELSNLAEALTCYARRKAGNGLSSFQSALAVNELKRALEQYSCYGICLTDKGDDSELWLRYAPDDGINIRFDYDRIYDYFKNIHVQVGFEDDNKNYLITQCDRVAYCVPSSCALDKRFNEIFGEQLVSIDALTSEEVLARLFRLSCLIKSREWRSESETRICFLNFADSGSNSALPSVSFDGKQEACDLKVAYTCGKFRYYYEIPFDPNLIEGIVVGPTCSIQDKDRLKRILRIAYFAGCKRQQYSLQPPSGVLGFLSDGSISSSLFCIGGRRR